MDSEPTPFAQHVKAERERAGLSIRELARRSGFTFSYLAALERGQFKGSAELAAKLASALGIDPQPFLDHFDIHPPLPEPRIYFRRALGVDADEAEVLARLIEDYQAKKRKGGGNHEKTNKN